MGGRLLSPTNGYPSTKFVMGVNSRRWPDSTCCLIIYGMGWLGIVEGLEPNLLAVCKKRSKLLQPSDHDAA
jgi:hypothetical protein